MYRSHVLVCGGTGCTSSGSQQIMETLKEEIKKAGLEQEVSVVQTGCHGLCALGPIMIVYPDASYPSSLPGDRYPGRRQGSYRHQLLQEAAPHRTS